MMTGKAGCQNGSLKAGGEVDALQHVCQSCRSFAPHTDGCERYPPDFKP